MSKEGQPFGQLKQRASLLDSQTVTLLPLSQLETCLADIDPDHLTPLIQSSHDLIVPQKGAGQVNQLPLVIRERDVRYQARRAVLYRRLLQSYPYNRPRQSGAKVKRASESFF